MQYTYQSLLEDTRRKIKAYFEDISKVIIHNKPLCYISATIKDKKTTFYVKKDDMVNLTGVVDIDDDYYGYCYRSVLDLDNVDYWIYILETGYYLIKTSKLREKVLEEEYDFKGHGLTRIGDDIEFYLVKEKKFKSWCQKI